jgi:hypothetical protein
MARHTRIKLATVATTLVAALGIVAIGPATGADAGKSLNRGDTGRSVCC